MIESSQHLRQNVWWVRDPSNPVLPTGAPGTFDATSCMNPYILHHGDEYHLYYAGGDDQGHRRICLATAPVAQPTEWQRHGPLFDIGEPGSFDARWCVLPHVVQIGPDRWHLYYTANSGVGKGLRAFPGIGVAISSDGKTWQKYEQNPILAPTGRAGDPDAMGIAGGSVLKTRLPDGTSEWRFYYTGCPTLGDDLFLDQQKCCCLAVSQDGLHWERRGAVMLRDPERDYENVAAAGPVVHQEEDGTFRMWYSAIGTRWGAYSIAYAESDDGLSWRRGDHYGDNLQLGPIGTGWDRQMVEYPAVIREENRLRLFYCGNGYGSSGTGTALSAPLRATATTQAGEVEIVAPEANARWRYRIPATIKCAEGNLATPQPGESRWHGPDAKGMLWYEWHTSLDGGMGASSNPSPLQAIHYRVMLTPSLDGIEVRITLKNESEQALHDLTLCFHHSPTSQAGASDFRLQESWQQTTSSAPSGGNAAASLGDLDVGATSTLVGKIQLASTAEGG